MSIVEVIPGKLYQGDAASAQAAVDVLHVDAVVNVSEAVSLIAQAPMGSPMYIRWPIADGNEVPDQPMLWSLASFISRLLVSGRKVYIHCGAGINRSNLLTALVLVVLGDRGQDALDTLIRLRGPGRLTLANETFRKWLVAQEAQ